MSEQEKEAFGAAGVALRWIVVGVVRGGENVEMPELIR